MGMSTDWEKVEYHETSEDRRHFTTLAWGFPATILIVTGTLFSLSYRFLDIPLRGIMISFSAVYSMILTWNFKKIVYYSEERLELLKKYAENPKIRRYSRTVMEKSPWWAKVRIGGKWIFYYLIAYTLFLFIIGILNLFSSSL